MPLAYSLLTGPLNRSVRWPQRAWFFPTPADQSVPDQAPRTQYVFRRGGFYQLLNRPALYPTPADQSIPDRPLLTPYVFRPGGFWQTQKALLYPTPADQSVPDQPPLRQYVFRKGGLWQTTKFALWLPLTPPNIVPPVGGGELGHVISDTLWGSFDRPTYILDDPPLGLAVLMALFASGEISEEEFAALLASIAN